MPTRTLLLFALTLVTPLAWAQEPARRVEREASNPMRMIIEAAKIRPKAKVAEVAKPAPRVTSEPVAAPAASEPPPEAPPEQPATVAAEPPPPAGPPESTVATVEAVAAPRSGGVPETTLPAAEPEPEPAPVLLPLKLANVVEPVTPRRLIGVLRGEVQVQVAFTVNADGSVAGAAVRRSSHPQLDASVLEAVRQWRYEPIAAPRPHEVQLVLRQPD
jgi:TonB family protein